MEFLKQWNWKRLWWSFRFVDGWLVFAVCGIIGFGLAALYSVNLGLPSQTFLSFKKQIIFLLLSVVCVLIVLLFDRRCLKQYAIPIYTFCASILALLLVLGRTIRGTTGWFVLGGFQIQPVEFAKIGLVLILAVYFSRRSRCMDQINHVVRSAVFPGLLMVLVLLQPDMGSAMVLGFIWLMMVMCSRTKWYYFALLFLIFVCVSVLSWEFLLQPYQKERILSFSSSTYDPLGSGYNRIQAMIAVGAGQFFGSGLALGSQSQLKFLPETQTDFIFAVMAQEFGFVGMCLFFALWLLFFYRLYVLMLLIRDDFELFVVLGFGWWVLFQLIQNVGMNMGLLPITGLALPFVSAGGSSLLALSFLFGMVLRIGIEARQQSIQH